ncbi:MAG: PQQ-binding-like beta-propeller repeat protein [Planctomycetaceae bacterium]|nr:PQQ-binding-like beta-propeller repeat protein [Planctomycetaceae bacterium]
MRSLSFAIVLCLLPAGLFAAEVSSPIRSVIAADKGKLVRYDEQGTPVWIYKEVKAVHRVQQLENGNLLTQQGWGKIIEVAPDKHIVWSYDAAHSNGNTGKAIEVHSFQRLPNGNTMVVENGIGRIIEVNNRGEIVHQLNYQVSHLDAHRDVRQAHKLDSGNYLVCHEADGRVVEYTPDGTIAWEYEVPLFDKPPAGGHGPEAWGNQVFNALRLKSGNTLIATGNGHSILEVTPEKEIVWQLHQQDLPGITLAWVTSLEVLPNGNILFGNCHAGPDNPQLIEVTRNKEVVWTFRDFDLLGNATAVSATAGSHPEILR